MLLFLLRPSGLSLSNRHSLLSISVTDQTFIHAGFWWRRNKKRRGGSHKSWRFVIESAYFIASKLNVLPEPLESVLREFGAGNGGGSGFWKGFGGGGFDGWGRKREKKLDSFLLFVGCFLGLWVILGKEIAGGLLPVFWGLFLFGASMDVWRGGVSKDWILGFCFCAVLMGLGWRREEWLPHAKGMRTMTFFRNKNRRGLV